MCSQVGGSSVIADAIVPTVSEGGGRVLFAARVTRVAAKTAQSPWHVFVNNEDKPVECEHLISAIGTRLTWKLLGDILPPLPMELPPETVSFSYTFVTLDCPVEEAGVPSSNVWYAMNNVVVRLRHSLFRGCTKTSGKRVTAATSTLHVNGRCLCV